MSSQWEILNQASSETHKLQNCAEIIAMLAENCTDNSFSSALWLCYDVVKEKSELIETAVEGLMSSNWQHNQEIERKNEEIAALKAKLLKKKAK